MRAGKLAFLLLATTLLVVYSLDCFSSGMMDQESMKCCGSMPCMPSNHSHDCCKTAVASHSPCIAAAGPSRVVAFTAVSVTPMLRVASPAASFARLIEPSEHAPPISFAFVSLPLLI